MIPLLAMGRNGSTHASCALLSEAIPVARQESRGMCQQETYGVYSVEYPLKKKKMSDNQGRFVYGKHKIPWAANY